MSNSSSSAEENPGPERGLLVLRKKAGDSILIGEDIELHFVDVRKQGIKVAIRAPKQIPIRSSAASKPARPAKTEDRPRARRRVVIDPA